MISNLMSTSTGSGGGVSGASVGGFTTGAIPFGNSAGFLTSDVNNLQFSNTTKSILGSTGTATTPSYTFVNDANTGMYNPVADALAFVTAGSNRMRINSAGDVGIGTNGPSFRVTIADSQTATTGDDYSAFYSFDMAPGSTSSANNYGVYNDTIFSANFTSTGAMYSGYFQSRMNGSQGIATLYGMQAYAWLSSVGVVTTAYALRARTDNSSSGTIINAYAENSIVVNSGTGTITNAYGVYATIANSGGGTIVAAYGAYIDTIQGASVWAVYSNATAPNYFAGNVGIGTNNPTRRLHLSTGATVAIRIDGAANVTTTVGAAGAGAVLPITPEGYLNVLLGATTYRIPYYIST